MIRFLNLEYFYQKIYEFLTGTTKAGVGFKELFQLILDILRPFSVFFSLFILTLIVYSFIRILQIRSEEKKKYDTVELTEGKIKNEKWENILKLVSSENSNDWRQAILEADVLLASLLKVQGYQGESLGEMLRGIEESDFNTLNQAWEAHKARNRIAHQGSDFVLTKREARRIIDLYSQVFEEFGII